MPALYRGEASGEENQDLDSGGCDRNDETARRNVAQSYRLWTRSWGDYELAIENQFKPSIRSLYSQDWSGDNETLIVDVELVPEPGGPRGRWAIAVRTDGRTLGYIEDDEAHKWAGTVRRIVASGFVPTTSGRIWGSEYDGWDGIEFNTSVRIALGNPNEATPVNDPPTVPYTMLPRSGIVQVTKEDEHFDVLLKSVPPGGYGTLFVTLHENVRTQGRAKPHVEVRIDDKRIGQLTPAMSQRFLPMVRHLQDRGLITACWGDITGSAVAAEVRIDGLKANEASQEVLDGPPATVPRLVPALSDPLEYDLSDALPMLTPIPPMPPTTVAISSEPPDGSLVRFDKSGGSYNYVAVRRGDHWQTTATSDWGSINEVMTWKDLARRVRKFDVAVAWAPVDPHDDPRVREYLAVTRFTINGLYLAAINVDDGGTLEGNWYTTISDRAEDDLPFGDYADWSEILTYGQHVQVVTSWAQLI